MTIGIINLNLNVERLYAVQGLMPGGVFREEGMHVHAGGKGVNAVRVLRTMGIPCALFGCAGGITGAQILRGLKEEGISVEPFTIRGDSRTCVVITDIRAGSQTVINEQGPRLTAAEVQRLRPALASFCSNNKAILFAGSVPRGITPATYAVMVRAAGSNGRPVVVDAAGEHLAAALKTVPFAIKPNRHEWEAATGKRFSSDIALRHSVQPLLARGIAWVIISSGAKGTFYFHGTHCWKAVPPRIRAVNTVGCGDALAAAFTAAVVAGLSSEEIVRSSMAVAAAHALTALPGQVRKKDIAALRRSIRIHRYI